MAAALAHVQHVDPGMIVPPRRDPNPFAQQQQQDKK